MKSLALLAALALPAAALAAPDPADWETVLAEAEGQTVYWHAWGGSSATNQFIDWLGDRVEAEYGVTLEHVKLTDTADAVTRVLSEKQSGTDDDGAVDLVWINGENFVSMKEADLLFGPFATELPNHDLVADDPIITSDFGTPVEGMESPWAKAQFVFMYDSADAEPVATMAELKDWAAEHPGRFTFPQPPDFLGTTFLKQALAILVEDPSVLQEPLEEDRFDAVTAPLWEYLDALNSDPLAFGSRLSRLRPGSVPAHHRRGDRHRAEPLAVRGLDRHREFPAPRHGPHLRARDRHDRERELRRDPLQFRLQGRGDGRGERASRPGGADSRPGSGHAGLRHRSRHAGARRGAAPGLRRARPRRRHPVAR